MSVHTFVCARSCLCVRVGICSMCALGVGAGGDEWGGGGGGGEEEGGEEEGGEEEGDYCNSWELVISGCRRARMKVPVSHPV